MKITNSLVALAAAMLAPVAAADVTITLTSRSLSGGASVVVPSLSGTLTGASINLTAVSGDPYSSDLTVVVTPGSSAPVGGAPKIGLAQIGGWWGDFVLNSNANTRLYWGNRATSETAVPLVRGPVNFTSSFNLTTNSAYRVWITNGYTNGSGTFTATVTLHGVSGPTSYYLDSDGDGYGAGTPFSFASSSGTSAVSYITAPAGYVTNNSDCNDSNAAIGAATVTYYRDQDGDGYGTSATSQVACSQPSGYVTDNTDCDDTRAGVNPAAQEVCDASNRDEDCDNLADNADISATGQTNWYADADGDGLGAGSATSACDPTGSQVATNTDCNDTNAAIGVATTFYRDEDGDGFGAPNNSQVACTQPSGYVADNTDCHDVLLNGGASVYPGALENCANISVDNDCDSDLSAAEAVDSTTYYRDQDTDGYSINTTAKFCASTAPTGYRSTLSSPVDCNDTIAWINPGVSEVCDSLNYDENCNGVADDSDSGATGKTNWYSDADGDGFGAGSATSACDPTGNQVATNTDCNDVTANGGASVYPGAVENCANIAVDNDCDGVMTAAEAGDSTTYYRDQDGDTYSINTTEQFCASTAPTGYRSTLSSPVDCNDTNAAINPGATEVCDAGNVSEDCDAGADDADPQGNATGKTNWYADADGDGFGAGSATVACDPTGNQVATNTDCNDVLANGGASVYPGALENCANIAVDNDCDGVTTEAEAVDSTTYYRDQDGDTYSINTTAQFCASTAPTGYRSTLSSPVDCDDTRAGVNPAAQEICDADNRDEDCDTLADNADSSADDAGKTNFYTDSDNDNYGVGTAQRFCDEPALFAPVAGDCNDVTANGGASVYPGALENCANIAVDNDCDGVTTEAEAVDSTTYYRDQDGDTYSISTTAQFCASTAPTGYLATLSSPVDCDDTRAGVNPAAQEICDADNRDEDCDNVADNNDSSAADAGKTNFYTDADNDNYGVGSAQRFCDEPALFAPVAGDCNDVTADGGASVYPGAVENCANIAVDNDCDSVTTEAEAVDSTTYYRDQDSDGHSISTTAQFCASTAPTGYLATLSSPVDCDDTRAGVNPAAQEICDADNRDEDCDNVADNNDSSAADAGKTNFYRDQDSDGRTTNTASRFCDLPSGYEASPEGDCVDTDANIYPGAVENCANDGTDNDCDGEALADSEAVDSVNYYTDADSDTFGATTATGQLSCSPVTGKVTNNTDCNDGDSAIKPTATEICDNGNVDENCNGVADNADSGAADAGKTNFYRDQDNDGRTTNTASRFCDLPAGYEAAPEGDCNDNNAAIYPGAVENCANLGVDNDCDSVNDDAEAVDSVAYYVDGDSDGFGAGSATMSCSPIGGSVTNNSDCDDTQLRYVDSDGDGFGAGAPAACGVSNNTDGCPTDANKQAPGVCGCGTADTDANSSGTADCADVTLAMTPLSTHIGPSGTLTVRVSMGASAIYSISGAGLSVAFDAAKLQFVSATPVAGGPFSSGSVVSSDNTAGTLRYTLSLGSSQSATQSAANLVDLAFSPVLGAEACGTAGLVSFGTVSSVGTSLSYSVGGSQSPVVSNLGAIYLDQTAPVITNAFADTALAADAGTIAGAAVTAPSVTAFDACANESRPVSLSIALAGGGTVTSWPVRFPVGVSTITWSSTDQAGNTATDVHTVTVANHQLLDLSVGFVGVIQGTSSRQIRVTAGGQVSLHTVNLTGSSGSVTGVQVPVAASYPCLAVKCPSHSVTDAMAASVSGVRYAATASLPQGDCNDDDMVEIFDYAIFVSQRGAGKATNAIANFNGDTAVGNADFTFIALNFFASGETCTPNVDAPQPRDRMSVKDLRRAGYGHLAVADLNRDGWVDLRDMQMYMQGAGMQGTIGAAQIESRTNGTRW